jgi:uncharacterized membrane protein YkoI
MLPQTAMEQYRAVRKDKLMRKSRIIAAVVIALALGGGAVAAFSEAGEEHESDAALALNAKVSLSDAIAAAEQQNGGKAIEATLDDEDGAASYEIKLVKAGAVQNLRVDLATGNVASATEDKD